MLDSWSNFWVSAQDLSPSAQGFQLNVGSLDFLLCASPEADGTDSVEYNKHVTSNDYMVSSVHRDASVGRSVMVNLPRVVDRIPLFLKSVSSRVI